MLQLSIRHSCKQNVHDLIHAHAKTARKTEITAQQKRKQRKRRLGEAASRYEEQIWIHLVFPLVSAVRKGKSVGRQEEDVEEDDKPRAVVIPCYMWLSDPCHLAAVRNKFLPLN